MLDLRVGIASGAVVTGDLEKEAASQRESVIGSIVHLAARLVARAAPGGVVIDDATQQLTGRFFEYRSLGRLRLKGFDQRVQAWLVLRALSAWPRRFEAKHPDRHLSAFVGASSRSPCCARAGSAPREATVPRWCSRATGIGKSRLAREVRREARDGGAMVLDIDCSQRAANTPLGPIARLVKRLIGAPPPNRPAQTHTPDLDACPSGIGPRRPCVPYVASLLDVSGPPADAAESADRFRERMIGVLVEMCRRSRLGSRSSSCTRTHIGPTRRRCNWWSR